MQSSNSAQTGAAVTSTGLSISCSSATDFRQPGSSSSLFCLRNHPAGGCVTPASQTQKSQKHRRFDLPIFVRKKNKKFGNALNGEQHSGNFWQLWAES